MKSWYFFAASFIMFTAAIFGLRYNDVTSLNMKNRIIERDAAGENVQSQREELKRFVFTHMNASRKVVLRGEYQRARTRAQAEADSSIDGSVYEEAQAACDREGQRTTENAECVQNYIKQRLDGSDAEVDLPSKDQFTYIYHSPRWTADLPGLSIAAGILSILVGCGVYAKRRLVRVHRQDA